MGVPDTRGPEPTAQTLEISGSLCSQLLKRTVVGAAGDYGHPRRFPTGPPPVPEKSAGVEVMCAPGWIGSAE